jgi:hypothetical protein
MSKWWNTDMADAGQALYSDPSLAINVATVPRALTDQQTQYKEDIEQTRNDKGGFLNAVGSVFGTADSWMSNIPGWGIAKQAVSYPIDKAATGLRWVYSNVVSQPVSTLLLHSARMDLGSNDAGLFSGWNQDWNKAEHISPGQAFTNYEDVRNATGDPTYLSQYFGDDGQNLSQHERDMVKQNVDRFVYDTDFWKSKSDWKYNVGSGSLDFMFNIVDPASAAIVGGAVKTVKGARSIQLVPQAAEHAAVVPGAAGVARTRGPLVDLFVRQQTPEQAANVPSMQKAFDWMKQEGRTTEEIASHPMWGRGRRINPARYDIAKLIKDTPRENMEQLWRFTAGDSNAAADLAASAPQVLKKLGQTMDNRVLLQGTRMNTSMVSYFKANYEDEAASGVAAGKVPGAPAVADEGSKFPQLLEPPYPRPNVPGPRQDGWDKTWGRLAVQSAVNRTAAADIASKTPLKIVGPAEQTTLADAMKADQWKAAQLDTIADDYDELLNNERYLGSVLGTMDNWTPAASPLFGAVGKAYRMGALGVRSTEKGAERAAIRSAGKRPKPIGGNFVMTAVKRGMGAPMTIIHNFGDRTPQGFVNHEADDARDRVFDMLKQVKGMTPESRLGLIEIYNGAGNKVERSQALDKIHDAVMNHILINNSKLHPEVAEVLKGAIKDGIASKMRELTGRTGVGRDQRFGPEATSPEDISKLTGKPVDDLVEDAKPVRSDQVVTSEDGHGIIVSPLARTQLSSNDILFPVQEINRLVKRSSGSFAGFRGGTGEAKDWVVKRLDGFDNLWKAATLLRPGFIPRMVSDEVLARMFKFGGMATLMDTGKGMGHFLSNRSRQVGAVIGKGSYVPTTGRGIASNRAIVALDDPAIIGKAEARGLKTARIKVPPTLRMAYGRISDESDALRETQKELALALRKENPDPGYISTLRSRAEDHQNVMDEFHDYVGEILRKAEVSKGRRLGDDDFTYKIGKTSYRVPKAFSAEWDNPIPRDQISSENAWKNLFTRNEMIDRQRFLSHAEKTGAYKLITPDDQNHMTSWLDALNMQIRQDPFHRMIASGADDKTALAWLKDNPEGRKYMSNMTYWNRDREQFVRNVRFMIDKYAGDEAIKAKIADNQIVTEAELRAAFTRDEFPTVHGEEIKQHSALKVHETANHWLDKQTEKAWKFMADIPADVLSRHPLFLQMHQHEMENLIRQQYHFKMQNFGDDTITPKEWEQMNQKAAARAKKQMSQVVYDPVNTVGSQGLRFVYPFFKPFINGVDRWAGLVAERPEQLTKLSKIYNAPVAANLVTDSSGHHVDTDGYATYDVVDPVTGKKHKERQFIPLKDRVLHLKAPWSKNPGQGGIPIRMGSLNTILPGDPWFDPGSGPIVQIAGNQLAKSNPQVGEFLQWAKILPYGPQESTSDLFTPKYMADAFAAYMGKDVNNTKYQQAVLDIYNMKTAQYYEQLRAGKHVDPPSMKEIQSEAKNFLWLQTLVDWVSPASVKSTPLTGTKYQFFVDQYKALQAADPVNARDQFLNMFGEDYSGFTTSLTKSMGIAASIPADRQMEKYRDLIAEDPDMAPLAIGDTYNGGPFSSSVYLKQMSDEIGGQRVRRRLTAEEAIADERVQEGWHAYMRSSKALNSELIRAGFTSYNQKGAEVFQQAKSNLINNLGAMNPGWAQAFGQTDRNAVPNRIAFMEKLVQDPKIMNDPMRGDAHVLYDYLIVRNQFKNMLAQRGLQQLSFDEAGNPAGQAADLGYAWRKYQMYFQNSSLQFETLFTRYLSNDDLQ